MNTPGQKTIFFAGYAPVHFLCFQPIYEALKRSGRHKVVLSGGLKSEADGVVSYDLEALYRPFNIPREELVPVEDLDGMRFDLAFGAQTNMIRPELADCRVQIFHGISFRNRAIRPENMGCDYYFLAGPYMHRNFIEAGFLEPNDPRALEIGFPKTDRLLDGSLDRSELLARYGFDGSRPVVLYAPTGQKRNSLELMGKKVIKQLLKSKSCDLVVKLHDHPKKTIDWQSRLASYDGRHFKLADDLDVIPLLFLADLLITDASSVSSEYSLLDRPMVFLDVPELIARAEAKAGARVDLNTWGRRCGHIAGTPEEAVDCVKRSLADPGEFSAVRQAMAKDLFYNPGRAAGAAVEWVMRHLEARTAGARESIRVS